MNDTHKLEAVIEYCREQEQFFQRVIIMQTDSLIVDIAKAQLLVVRDVLHLAVSK